MSGLLPVAEALERLLAGAEPLRCGNRAARRRGRPGARRAGEGAAHAAALPCLGHGRLRGARRGRGARAGAIDRDRHGGSRKAVRRHGRQGRGGAHLHRRAGARRRRHDRHPGKCEEARRRRDRGVRDGRGQPAHTRRRARFRRGPAASRKRPRARCGSTFARGGGEPPCPAGGEAAAGRDHRHRRRAFAARAARPARTRSSRRTPMAWPRSPGRPARACSISASRPTGSRRFRRWSTRQWTPAPM